MRLLAATVLASIASVAFADGTYHKVQIPGWTIETSEYFEQGTRLKASYPLYNLLDGKPSTAWVYNDLDYPKAKNIDGLAKPGRYYVQFTPDSPTVIDELRIQIGYQKSTELFRKNSRPAQLKIYSGHPEFEKPIRTIDLKDTMGWKSIRVPRLKYEHLYVEISGITRGPVDDLCVSEMMPRAGGSNLIKLPATFMYTEGGSCCGANYELLNSNGKRFVEAGGEFPAFEFSPDGTFVAGFDSSKERIWVANVSTGSVVWSKRAKKNEYADRIDWQNNRSFEVSLFGSSSQRVVKGRL